MEKIKHFARLAAKSAVLEGVGPEDKDELQRLQEDLKKTQVPVIDILSILLPQTVPSGLGAFPLMTVV